MMVAHECQLLQLPIETTMEAINGLGPSFAAHIIFLETSAHWARDQLSPWKNIAARPQGKNSACQSSLGQHPRSLVVASGHHLILVKGFCSFSPGIRRMHTSERIVDHIAAFKKVREQLWVAGLCSLLWVYHQGRCRGQTALLLRTIVYCQLWLPSYPLFFCSINIS